MSLPRCFRRSLHKGCDPFGRSRSGSEKMKYSCLHLGSDTTREIRIPDIMSGMSDGAQCVKHRNPSNGGSIGSVSVRLKHSHLAGMVMSGATHISTLYRASFSRKMPLVWQVVADSQERALRSRNTPITASMHIFWRSKWHLNSGKRCKTWVRHKGHPSTNRLCNRS